MVNGDSQFGFISTAIAMYNHNLFIFSSVKTGAYAYPQAVIKDRCKQRGDSVFLRKQFLVALTRQQTDVQTVNIIAAGYRDNSPLALVAAMGMSTDCEVA